MRRSGRLYLFTLFVLAFVVRFCYARWGLWWAGDSPVYLDLASNLAFYHSFSEVIGVPTASRPPLYPLLIAAFWWTANTPVTAVILAQCIFGAASVVLVYLIAKDRFDHRVAFIAALAFSFAPMTVHYTAVLLTETLFTFLVLLAIFFWGRNRGVAAGLSFGLAGLTRSAVFPFLLLLPLLALLPPWRANRRLYLLIFLAALSVASVWTIRNALVFRRFILVQSGGYGTNLFAGTIETQLYGDDVWRKVNQELVSNAGDPRDDVVRDREYMRRAIDRIKSDPAHYLKVRLKQYPRLFMDSGDYLLGTQNVAFTQALRERRFLVIVVKLGFLLGNIALLVLAIYGMLIERRRFVSLSHLILFPVFLALVHVPMWIESRYSLSMVPFLLIFSARGVEQLVKRMKHDY